jgi:hypothetical protein
LEKTPGCCSSLKEVGRLEKAHLTSSKLQKEEETSGSTLLLLLW